MLSAGTRIKTLRIFMGMTRDDFCARHAINFDTLTSIETGRLKISLKQLNKIMTAFTREGVRVHPLWIREGKGPSPIGYFSNSQEHSFLEDWAKGFSAHKDCVISRITGDHMEPFYSAGDLVGGLWSAQPHLLLGKRCILRIKDHMHVGVLLYEKEAFVLHPSNHLTCGDSVSLPDHHLVHIAEILWHIRYQNTDAASTSTWPALSMRLP